MWEPVPPQAVPVWEPVPAQRPRERSSEGQCSGLGDWPGASSGGRPMSSCQCPIIPQGSGQQRFWSTHYFKLKSACQCGWECASVCVCAPACFGIVSLKTSKQTREKITIQEKQYKKNIIFLKKERKEGIKKEKEEEEDDAEEIVGACRKARRQTDVDESITVVTRLDQHLPRSLTICVLRMSRQCLYAS